MDTSDSCCVVTFAPDISSVKTGMTEEDCDLLFNTEFPINGDGFHDFCLFRTAFAKGFPGPLASPSVGLAPKRTLQPLWLVILNFDVNSQVYARPSLCMR